MSKIKLEFTVRQAEEIFDMMNEGSVLYIENKEMWKEWAAARVCRNAIESFHKQLSDHKRAER
tara:strand:+ start:228 stop:416 length:189 start_codon:yes stop_codon:yes gene_type:complete